MYGKLGQLGQADAWMIDLEDSITPGDKGPARQRLESWLAGQAGRVWRGPTLVPRINALGSAHFEDDVRVVVSSAHVGMLSVGKIGSSRDMAAIEEALSQAEATAGRPRGSVRVVAWLETASGIVHAGDILRHPRISAAAFGADDFLADMEVERAEGGRLLDHARVSMAVAAQACGVPALESPCPNFREPEVLAKACADARALGYRGMFAIHPAQVEGIQRAFSPDSAAIAHARRVVDAYQVAEADGAGSTSLDGVMVDRPVYERSLKVLRRAGLLHL